MEKHYNEKYQEVYYTTTLDNGLRVIVWEKPEHVNSFFTFATPLGAINLQQKVGEARHKFHSGVAHFLEHKMFESIDQHDVMEDFSRLGCNINAGTSYDETAYYFSTTRLDIKEPLELLLDFVQHFSVSKKTVEKEKGIILSEYRMYLQNPEIRIVNEIFRSLYHFLPLREDIAGDEENIVAITKEELQLAHNINYHPTNMVFIAVGPHPAEEIIALVQENQNKKKFKPIPPVEKIFDSEPYAIARENFELEMKLAQPKIAVAYKFAISHLEKKQVVHLNTLAQFWTYAHFSPNNPQYQKWLDDEVINDSFSVAMDFGENYAYLVLYGDDLGNDFVAVLTTYLAEIRVKPFSATLLQQIKNRYIGKAIQELNSAEEIAFSTLHLNWFDTGFLEYIDMMAEIEVEDFIALSDYIDLNNRATIKLI